MYLSRSSGAHWYSRDTKVWRSLETKDRNQRTQAKTECVKGLKSITHNTEKCANETTQHGRNDSEDGGDKTSNIRPIQKVIISFRVAGTKNRDDLHDNAKEGLNTT
jgi:hypothetical protein